MRDAPPVIPTQTGRAGTIIACVGIVAALAGAVVLYLFDPAHNALYPRCFFKVATGLDCPGCGGLRATHQLLHGHLREAFRLNPLFIVSIPVVAFLCGRLACEKMLHRKWPRLFSPTTVAWICISAFISFGVLRNLPWRAWFAR